MQLLEVGKPSPYVLPFEDGGVFDWTKSGSPTIYLVKKRFSKRLLDEVKKGFEFALTIKGTVMFFLLRTHKGDGMEWSEMSFSAQVIPPEQRPEVPPKVTDKSRMTLNIISIESSTNTIAATMYCTISPEMSQLIWHTLHKQNSLPLATPNDYGNTLAEIHSRYSVLEILSDASAKCNSGD